MAPIIRLHTPDDFEALAALYRTINPDRPPMTAEEVGHGVAAQPPEARHELWVAEIEGQVVARANWNRLVYVKEPGAYWCYIGVLPAHRGQGIGRALWDLGLSRLQQHGAQRIYTRLRGDDPDAQAWVERRGFQATGHGDRLSQLDVARARLDRSRQARGRMSGHGITIATLADLGRSDALLQALHQLDDETSRDVPGSEPWGGIPFEEWLTHSVDMQGARDDAFWIALQGEKPVGMAQLVVRAGGFADNGYTAVARAYRGKGVARALKLATVEWARENSIHTIVTGNDPENRPMLAINIEMGYAPLPANVEMVKTLTD